MTEPTTMDFVMATKRFRECPDCRPPSGFMLAAKQYMVMVGIDLGGGRGICQHTCPVCGYKTPSDERVARLTRKD